MGRFCPQEARVKKIPARLKAKFASWAEGRFCRMAKMQKLPSGQSAAIADRKNNDYIDCV
jgi:hypothetical protein